MEKFHIILPRQATYGIHAGDTACVRVVGREQQGHHDYWWMVGQELPCQLPARPGQACAAEHFKPLTWRKQVWAIPTCAASCAWGYDAKDLATCHQSATGRWICSRTLGQVLTPCQPDP
jgi:hypothetical protein